MRVVAFVQARMGSSRLPGKVLAPLAGEPALVCVVDRVARTPGLDDVAVLTSDLPGDAPIRELADARGIALFAGSEADVLDRFYRGAEAFGADLILRITGDCPLVDPGVLGELLGLRGRTRADHAGVATGALAVRPGLRRYPDGLDAEALPAAILAQAWEEARDPYEREHVTPFVWRRPERFRLELLEAPRDLGAERWTLDRADDLAFVQAVYERLGGGDFGWRDVCELLVREPELRDLNASARDASEPLHRPTSTQSSPAARDALTWARDD